MKSESCPIVKHHPDEVSGSRDTEAHIIAKSMMHIAKSMMSPNKSYCYVLTFLWLPHKKKFARFSSVIKLSALVLRPDRISDRMSTNKTTIQCVSLEQEGRGTATSNNHGEPSLLFSS